MSGWGGGLAGDAVSTARRQKQSDLGGASTSSQIQVGFSDTLDEEVGYLSNSVSQLKHMAREIGHESKRTQDVQEQLEASLQQAQLMVSRGLVHIKRAHTRLTSSCGHMVIFMVYIVAIVMFVFFFTKLKKTLTWLF